MTISFFVAGVPRPQGSKRAFMRPGAKHPTMIESAGELLKDWRASVAYTASSQNKQIHGPVGVSLDFVFDRPKSHFGTGRNAGKQKDSAPKKHTKKPDIDKLSRAILDALTNVAIADDSAVTQLIATKRYANHDERCGCLVNVWPSGDEDNQQ